LKVVSCSVHPEFHSCRCYSHGADAPACERTATLFAIIKLSLGQRWLVQFRPALPEELRVEIGSLTSCPILLLTAIIELCRRHKAQTFHGISKVGIEFWRERFSLRGKTTVNCQESAFNALTNMTVLMFVPDFQCNYLSRI